MPTFQDFLNRGGLAPLPTSAAAECPVCLEPATDPVIVTGITCAKGCQHQTRVFCHDCGFRWFARHGKCIICREELFDEPEEGVEIPQEAEAAQEDEPEEELDEFSLIVVRHNNTFIAEPVDNFAHCPTIVNHIHAVIDWAGHDAAGPAPILDTTPVRIDIRVLTHWILSRANIVIGYHGKEAANYTEVEDFVQAVWCACNEIYLKESILPFAEFHHKLVRLTFGGHMIDTRGEYEAFEEAVRRGLPLPAGQTYEQRFAKELIRELARVSARVHSYYTIVLGAEEV